MQCRKAVAILCSFFLVVFIAGCTRKQKQVETGQPQEVVMEVNELTEEEIQLLSQAFVDADRIRKGELLSYEEDLLEQIRFGKAYLSQKYPGEMFVLDNCIPQNNLNAYTSFALRTDGSGELYELRLETASDGTITACDNFYGALIREEYALRLETVAEGCLGAWVDIPYLYGEEYNADLSLDTLLEKGLPLYADGAVYFVASSGKPSEEEKCEILKKQMEKWGMKGQFWVYFVKEPPEGWTAIQELRDFVNAKRDKVLQSRKKIVVS